MDLFKRLPLKPLDSSWPPFPDDAKPEYLALADRFAVADGAVLPAFLEQDAAAAAAQNRFRRFRLILMVGAALTTIFGAVQAALGDAAWPGVFVAILGLATGAIANQYRRTQPLSRYLTSRAKAEELRSLYFRYLSGVDGAEQRELEKRVAAISHSKRAGDDHE